MGCTLVENVEHDVAKKETFEKIKM